MNEKTSQPTLQVVLPQEHEEALLSRLGQLADVAIQSAIERASIQKRFVSQLELKKLLSIGADTLFELEAKGLKSIKLGKKHLYDLEEVYELLIKMKE